MAKFDAPGAGAGLSGPAPRVRPHPRTLGWFGTSALAMGGANQSIFLLATLLAGQSSIPGQGSAAIPLLAVGLLLAWMMAPGWTELILMWPNRVGGIAATCAEAFRPYNPVLANLTGVCYWWGWVPTSGLAASLIASVLHSWYLPGLPVTGLAIGLVTFFTLLNLAGIHWVTRLASPIALISALLAFVSGLAPIFTGATDWRRATDFHLTTPFPGGFGHLTSLMAGLFIIGFVAPAFETAGCHVGETRDPARNVPRAMAVSAVMASVYFVLLPAVWLGMFGPQSLAQDLDKLLGPTFAPVFGAGARAAAIWFIITSMCMDSIQPLAGAPRTLMQLAEDGLLPRLFARRNRADAPWAATLLTAGLSIVFMLCGDPLWVIAATNFTYLISLSLTALAIWLLRRDHPNMARPWRAPDLTITTGLCAGIAWGGSAIFGFQQYGLPTVLAGLILAYSGVFLYAWRRIADRRAAGLPGLLPSLHVKLTGAMVVVLGLDAFGYWLAIGSNNPQPSAHTAALQDIFVIVALLTVGVGLVLPGMIAHTVEQVSGAARNLAAGTLAEFSRAIQALGRGDLDAAHARVAIRPVVIRSRDEVGRMADSFNAMQEKVAHAVTGLEDAREGLRQARLQLTRSNASLEQRVEELHQSLIERGAAEDALRKSQRRLELAVQAAALGTYEWDLRTNELMGSPTLTALLGRSPGQSVKTQTEFEAQVHPDDRPMLRTAIRRALESDGRLYAEYRIVWPNGEVHWMIEEGEAVQDASGRFVSMFGVVLDFTDRKEHEHRLSFMAQYDALTGLPNRHLFQDRLAQAIARAARENALVALMFLDLDRFKEINDSLGHETGDRVLHEVAARLRGCVREHDTVARIGGDEFTVILEQISQPEQVVPVAQNILDVFALPVIIEGMEFFLTTSIGIVLWPQDDRQTEGMLKKADMAMYQAKEAGRNNYQFFTPALNAQAVERLNLKNQLRHAIERDELYLLYQPKVDLTTGRIIGSEALVRWRHPEMGLIPPATFIPVAEDSGLIIPIGEAVLRMACAQNHAWQQAGLPRIPVAVNLSALQIRQRQFAQALARILRETGLSSRYLELELTESLLMHNATDIILTLQQLKEMGIQLSIDDFGTGYSSLSYLKRFPVDKLKIDRSFVRDITTDPDDAAITSTIISMAHSLRLTVIAEGVETEDQLAFLAAHDCNEVQGYFFSEPLPPEEFTRLLENGLSHAVRRYLKPQTAE